MSAVVMDFNHTTDMLLQEKRSNVISATILRVCLSNFGYIRHFM